MKSARHGTRNHFFYIGNLRTSLYLRRHVWFGISFVIMVLLMSSCASTSRMAIPLTNFSTSVAETTVATKAALGTMQSVDMEKLAYEVSTKPEKLSEKSFQWFMSSDDVYQRILVLDALAAYAGKMKELSGLDKNEDIKKNFSELKTNLDSISKTIETASNVSNKVPEGIVELIAQIGEGIVSLYVSQERDQAISEALGKTNPYIQQMCKLMSSEYSKEQRGIFYKQLENSYRKLEGPISKKFESAKEPEKLSLAKEYGTLLRKKEISLKLLDSIGDSFNQIAAAHNALLLQSRQNINSDDQLSALNAQIETTKYFYSQLAK